MNNYNSRALSDAINELVSKLGWEEKLVLSQIIINWKSIIGENMFDVVTPKNLENGVLHLTTESSVWRSELLIRKNQIVDKINGFIGKESIKDLIIR